MFRNSNVLFTTRATTCVSLLIFLFTPRKSKTLFTFEIQVCFYIVVGRIIESSANARTNMSLLIRRVVNSCVAGFQQRAVLHRYGWHVDIYICTAKKQEEDEGDKFSVLFQLRFQCSPAAAAMLKQSSRLITLSKDSSYFFFLLVSCCWLIVHKKKEKLPRRRS